MQISHDVAVKYTNLINTMFDANQYSAITKRQEQFQLLNESMKQLTYDCNGLLDLAQSKRRKLSQVSEKMQYMVESLKKETDERVKQVIHDKLIIDDDTMISDEAAQ